LAGSLRFSGAAVLCAEAAMRCGAGLVTLGVPENVARPIIKFKPREIMLLPLHETKEGTLSPSGYKKIKNFAITADILALGPGLSQNKSTQTLIRKIVATVNKPMVIDADGLNALIGNLGILSAKPYTLNPKILTPHPGEMAKLLGTSIKKIQKQRKDAAVNFAKKYKVTVVLKGHNTIVADYKNNLYVNKTGNPGMATAGSGDVLTGIVSAFLAQGLDSFSAAKFGVYIHGLAGDLAAKEKTEISLIASDLIGKIPDAIKISS